MRIPNVVVIFAGVLLKEKKNTISWFLTKTPIICYPFLVLSSQISFSALFYKQEGYQPFQTTSLPSRIPDISGNFQDYARSKVILQIQSFIF
ncbi:hypothetical protein PNOK_0334900 [Pyrrhoderma noxium]|uniref:Uncharacterized protein n=1 Tax=Pyrrhoderma noxium TaxID=2282107 RepID=A0A286UMC9_9AGAM|nr:hypothetical protein PNOK_0334900 [Pyrrhoderma noxium]